MPRGLPTHASPASLGHTGGAGFDPSEKWPVIVDPDSGCWLWQGLKNPDGYGRVWVKNHYLAHRLVYETEVGPIPGGLVPDHLCRVPACVNPHPDHSQLVTRGQNCRRGRNTQLTWEQVEQIRALVADGAKQQEVAKRFKTSPTNVSLIVKKRRWAVESHEEAYGADWPVEAELRTLGTIPIPEGSAERVWMRVLGECSTAHAAEADSPHHEPGITAPFSPFAPDRPRPAIRGAGERRGSA